MESPIFHIELDHVCPTYLHIVLGIVKKHHSLLEEQCHQLDNKIAKHLAQGNDPEPDKKTHFSTHISSLRRMQTNPSDQQLQFRTGPVAQELDTVLKKHNIDVQSFHGRSFNGNHCNKYLKEAVYSDICSSPVRVTESLVDDPDLVAEAVLHQLFEGLNRASARYTNTSPMIYLLLQLLFQE